MKPVIVRTFRRRIRLHAPDAEARSALAFLEADPTIGMPIEEELDLQIEALGPFFSVMISEERRIEGSIGHLVFELHHHIQALIFSETQGLPVIGGAAVLVGEQRILILGDDNFRRSSLLLRLLHEEDVAVEGNALVSLDGEVATAWPQTLRVRPQAIAAHSATAAHVRRAPSMTDHYGSRTHAVVPSLQTWRIRTGPIRHIVVLENNEGGTSTMGGAERGRIFRALMDASFLPKENRSRAVASLSRLVSTAQLHHLSLGGLDRAAWHLTRGIGGRYGDEHMAFG